mmetsp:Transcript_20159/g.20259  ORF Transcript_20159/g.20259 Transcript_20159/m.20259 type:complete len:178 (-) Transcript_20159:132-665(-)
MVFSSRKTSLKSLSSQYNDLMVKYPFYTNAVCGAIITAAGTSISQLMSASLNFKEILVMVMIVIFYNTPILLKWFKYLQTSKTSVVTQVLLDQFVFSPPFSAGIMSLRFYLLGEATTIMTIMLKLMLIFPKTLVTSWFFWIPCRAVITMYVPPHMQIVAVNACSLIWTIIFTLMARG